MLYHNFYDTETTGPDPKFDQVLQAAAILTDDDFREVEWIDERSRLATHIVPTAGALKVTGVDPYSIARAKHSAYEFAKMLHETFIAWQRRGSEMSYTGYNTIRFDEEIMRQMFWQNLLDPYLSSGKGTYRNDLLTVVRSLYARNPDCFEVPKREDGKNNFKLENIAPLNGFDDHAAHDALGDVRATIHIARMVRDTDPALWQHMLAMGNAKTATDFVDSEVIFRQLGGPMLDPGILDVCLIATEAANNKSKSAWNLAVDPTPYLDLSPEEILDAMRKTGTPFRTVKCNKQPAVFPINWEFLAQVSNDQFEPADPATIEERAEMIRGHQGFQHATAEALRLKTEGYEAPKVLEDKIYAGFPTWDDKNRMKQFHNVSGWDQKLEIVRSLKKAEMRQIGLRLVFHNAPELLTPSVREASAKNILEERHCLHTDRPWNTVGKLMQEIDEWLEREPGDPELLNIRAWALETYPSASDWTGTPPEAEVAADEDAEVGEQVTPAADADAPTTEAAAPDVEKAAPLVATRMVEAASAHYLDGIDG
jgi:exodeoxyribonuclease I